MSEKQKLPDCKYNKSIMCPANIRHCDKCAWNPAVNKVRLEKVRREHTHYVKADD